jgi:PAS domain S-box-containing protein
VSDKRHSIVSSVQDSPGAPGGREGERPRAEATLEIPEFDARGRSAATTGAKPIFFRFILLVIAVNGVFGLGLVLVDINDSVRQVKEALSYSSDQVIGTCARMRQLEPGLDAQRLVARCARLTDTSLALLHPTRDEVVFQTTPEITRMLSRVYRDGGVKRGMRVSISDKLGKLSGAWTVHPFAGQRLLAVVHRAPEDLGYFEHLTIGAGVLVLGLVLSIAIMLASARWVLYQPVQRLVDRLTGALARDIERRRAAEQKAVAARFEAEEHLTFRDNLLDASRSVGIIGTDLAGVVRIFNRGAEQILGYTEAEVCGKQTLDEMRERSRSEAAEGKQLPLRSLMQLVPGQEFRVDKHGKELLLSINESEILDSTGQRAGQLVTFVDISEQKRLEAELQLNEMQLIQSAKMASLGEMATGVAHELNQPLNNIGLLTSRVLRRLPRLPDDKERHFFAEKLQRVQGQVERASRIIEQMRTFGRRSDETNVFAIELGPPLAHVEEMLGEQLRSAEIDFVVELPSELPLVLADSGQLEQVLLNLLINARDAFEDGAGHKDWTPPERREVRVEVRTPPGDERVELVVSDNGPGMSDEVRARAFQPFYTTKEVGRGTGLGLAITYSLIRGFGGTLALESAPGRGSTFTISLRQVQSESEQSESEQSESEQSESEHGEGEDSAGR